MLHLNTPQFTFGGYCSFPGNDQQKKASDLSCHLQKRKKLLLRTFATTGHPVVTLFGLDILAPQPTCLDSVSYRIIRAV